MIKPQKIIIIGAGGHARVLADIVRANAAIGDYLQFTGFIDEKLPVRHHFISSPESWVVIGRDEDLTVLKTSESIDGFCIGVGGIRGGNTIRQTLFNRAVAAGLLPVSLCHPKAIIAPDVEIDPGSVVMAGAVINTGSRIGKNVIINTRASIDHDARIEDHVHIAPGAVLSGNVLVKSGAMIGVGAVIMQGITIGQNATIGAGSVVVKNIPDNATAVGVPARTRS